MNSGRILFLQRTMELLLVLIGSSRQLKALGENTKQNSISLPKPGVKVSKEAQLSDSAQSRCRREFLPILVGPVFI